MSNRTVWRENWFEHIEPDNTEQDDFMENLSEIFNSSENNYDTFVEKVSTNFEVEDIFNSEILSNHGLQKRVYQILQKDFNASPNPPVMLRAKYTSKWANLLYPGEQNENRIKALSIIKELSSSNRAGTNRRNTYTAESELISAVNSSEKNIQNTTESSEGTRINKLSSIIEQLSTEIKQMKVERQRNTKNGTQTDTQGRSDRNRAHVDLSNRYKHKDNRYSGRDIEDLDEFFTDYNAVCTDFNLTKAQKFAYLHNIFRGDAIRYYNIEVKPNATNYNEAYILMREHFCSANVQSRVKIELQKLDFEKFIQSEGSESKALSKITEHISKNMSKCPSSFQSEDTKIDLLKKALLKYH